MKCASCGVSVGSGAAWGPCVPGGHLKMVCSACAVVPQTKSAPRTVSNATPTMLERIHNSRAALGVNALVSDPADRKALVAALVAGRVILLDGDRITSAQ
jgi:hypothetical protein